MSEHNEGLLRAMARRPINEVWVDDPAPGGWICGVCLYPVESEPCEQHTDAALTDEQLERLTRDDDEPCLCGTGFTCMARHDGRKSREAVGQS